MFGAAAGYKRREASLGKQLEGEKGVEGMIYGSNLGCSH